MRKKIAAVFFLSALLFALGSVRAEAASLFMLPKDVRYNRGETFNIDLKINATDEFLNAAQATVSFPTDVLELLSADKTDSAFNFWVEEPSISNENGALSFIGGITRGISGSSLQVIRLTFKAKGAGSATLSISNAVVAANDGKGTNILGAVEGATLVVGNLDSQTAVAPRAGAAAAAVPQKVVRQAVAAAQIPIKPAVAVPLYPDSSAWYSAQGEAVALWEVPNDALAVAVALDHNPDTMPTEPETELVTGKSLGVLAEGVWYVHVRFKNNIGWGDTSRYKIHIDTTAPLAFDASIDSEASDNPTPQISFSTADSLSGIGLYQIYVDKERISETDKNSFVLTPQGPGKHTLRIKATDRAGNSTESVLPFEIIPLETPLVSFYPRTISQNEKLFVSGTAFPEAGLIFAVKKGTNEIYKGVVNADKTGKWEFSANNPFTSGNYSFNLTAVNERGAKSFPTEDNKFRVRALVLFSVGSIDIGWFDIFALLLALVAGGAAWFIWKESEKYKTRGAYSTVFSRDVVKFGAMMEEELNEMKKKIINQPDVSFRIENIYELVGRMKKYLSQEMGALKK